MNAEKPVTIKTLSTMLGMSERSVNTYLKEVKSFCDKEDIPYVSKRGLGVYLNISKSDSKIMNYTNDVSYYDPKYRRHYMKQVLLEDWAGYPISLFAEELFTSKTSILNDLVEISDWFSLYDITVIRKSKKGVYIEGSELNKRCAIVDYRKDIFGENSKKYNKTIDASICDFRISSKDLNRLISYYGEDLFVKVCKCISSYEKTAIRYFTDYSYLMLVEYISVQQQRLKDGYEIKDCSITFANGHCISEFIQFVENYFSVHFSYCETYYLQILFLSSEFQNYSIDYQCIREQSEKDIAKLLTTETLGYLSLMLHINIENDEEIKKSIYHFLYHSLIRINYNISIFNPFLDDIKKNYGHIFNICLSFEKYRLPNNKKPSQHEIGFLTLLINDYVAGMGESINGIMIGSGNLFSANMIRMKIEQKIPTIKVNSILSADFMCDIDTAMDCDIIITTLQNYKKTTNIPIVQITPLVTEKDVLTIEHACQGANNKKKFENKELTLLDYIKPEFIFLDNINYTSKENLIKNACCYLEEAECVSSEYYKEVLHREKISSTELDFNVAIPHGVENNIKKPAVLLIRLPKKMDWGSSPVDIIFLLALNFNDIGMTREFFKIFYDKVSNEEIIKNIRYAQNKWVILDILK